MVNMCACGTLELHCPFSWETENPTDYPMMVQDGDSVNQRERLWVRWSAHRSRRSCGYLQEPKCSHFELIARLLLFELSAKGEHLPISNNWERMDLHMSLPASFWSPRNEWACSSGSTTIVRSRTFDRPMSISQVTSMPWRIRSNGQWNNSLQVLRFSVWNRRMGSATRAVKLAQKNVTAIKYSVQESCLALSLITSQW
jgi:hypothetical protein